MMATVVDALVVSLGLDAKEFSDGMKQATTALKEFQKDAKVNIGGAVQNISQGMSAFRALMISRMGWATLGGIRDMAEEMTQAQFKTYRLAKAFNVNAQELAAWQKAVQVAGGSPEAFNKSIENMVANLRKVGVGLAGVRMSGFGLGLGLGVSSFGDPLKTMASLARTMKGMDMGRALVIGEKLGIDRDTIYMLRQGGAELVNLVAQMKELGSPTEEQLARTNQLRMQMEVFKLTVNRVKEQLFIALAPAIKFVTEKLTDLSKWMTKHPKLIEYAFYGIATALGVATVAMTAFTVAAMMNPVVAAIVAVSAAVGGLVALVKYLYDEWTDGNSEVHSSLEPIVTALKRVWEALRPFVREGLAYNLHQLYIGFDSIKAILELIGNILNGDWDKASESFAKLMDAWKRSVAVFVNESAMYLGMFWRELLKEIDDFVAQGSQKMGRFFLKWGLPGFGLELDKALENMGVYKSLASEGGSKGKTIDVTVGSVVVQSPTDKPEDLGNATRSALEETFREFGMSVLLST